MSVVFYKFRSAKDFDKAVFDGLSISVFDLKREIMVNKKLGKGTDFDLAIFNAQSNEEYTDDAAMIPRNTSILVQRNPAKKSGRGNAQLYLGLSAQPSASSSAPGSSTGQTIGTTGRPYSGGRGGFQGGRPTPRGYGGHAPFQSGATTLEGSSLSPANPAPAVSAVDLEGMTEDQKIEAMLATESQQWEEEMKQRPGPRPWNGGGFRRGGFGGEGGHHGGPGFLSNRPPPPDYVCHRCLKKGHYKNQCPTIGDPVFDRPRPKPTTGIPKSFLKAVPLDGAASDVDRLQAAASAGVMVTPDGELVVVQPNRAAWSKVSEKTSKAKFAFGDMYDSAPVLDPSFECPICHGNMKGAVTASCCGSKFCEECIREKLNENDDTCPKCKKSLTLDGLVPDDELRKNIEAKLLELFNQPTEKEKGGANQQKQQQQQQQQHQQTLSPSSGPSLRVASPITSSGPRSIPVAGGDITSTARSNGSRAFRILEPSSSQHSSQPQQQRVHTQTPFAHGSGIGMQMNSMPAFPAGIDVRWHPQQQQMMARMSGGGMNGGLGGFTGGVGGGAFFPGSGGMGQRMQPYGNAGFMMGGVAAPVSGVHFGRSGGANVMMGGVGRPMMQMMGGAALGVGTPGGVIMNGAGGPVHSGYGPTDLPSRKRVTRETDVIDVTESSKNRKVG